MPTKVFFPVLSPIKLNGKFFGPKSHSAATATTKNAIAAEEFENERQANELYKLGVIGEPFELEVPDQPANFQEAMTQTRGGRGKPKPSAVVEPDQGGEGGQEGSDPKTNTEGGQDGAQGEDKAK